MKWKTNGIQFRRGYHECLIAQFNGYGCWWGLGAMATQQTMKSEFKRLGDYLGATQCEVKELYDEDGNETERDVLYFRFNYLDRGLWLFLPKTGSDLKDRFGHTREEATAHIG